MSFAFSHTISNSQVEYLKKSSARRRTVNSILSMCLNSRYESRAEVDWIKGTKWMDRER